MAQDTRFEQLPLGRKVRAAVLATLLALLAIEAVSWLLLAVLPEPPRVQFALETVWEHDRHPLHRPDPDLLWVPRPGVARDDITINEFGFRGLPIRAPRPDAAYRILLLGDSVTFGFGVNDAETYGRQLDARLDHDLAPGPWRGVDPEVVNGGVIGYSSLQGLRWYERQARVWEPNLVCAAFGYNDHHSSRLGDRERIEKREFEEGDRFFRLRTYRLFERIAGAHRQHGLRRAPRPRVNLDEFEDNVVALSQAAARDGARCVFLTIPIRPDIPLVENFCPAEVGAGEILWVRQIDFALRAVGAEWQGIFKGHFLGREGLGEFAATPEHGDLLAQLTRAHPGLPIFHYLSAACHRAAGETAAAEAAMRECRRTDRERAEMEAYNARLRDLMRRGEIEVFDLATAVDRHPDRNGYFADVVHPTPEGHALIAALLLEYLAGTSATPAERDSGR